jgi:hypothetical protein
MAPEKVATFAEPILGVLADALRSPRWDAPDAPGSAHIVELAERVQDANAYSGFRSTAEGAYFLQIVEPLQEALNDDWLPFELFGLRLPSAREFIAGVIEEIQMHGLSRSVPALRVLYSKLARE